MKTQHSIGRVLVLAFLLIRFGALGQAQNSTNQEHWVATWAASPQQPPAAGGGQRGPALAAPAPVVITPAAPTVGAPTVAAPVPAPVPGGPAAPAAGPAGPAGRGNGGLPPAVGLNDQTIRMFVRTSLGGQRLRVEFSNAYGTTPLSIGAAHVALRSKDSAIVAGSDRALTFNGKPSVKIPPGAAILSDAVALTVPKLADLAISVYSPGDTGPATRHSMALRNGYLSPGNLANAAEFPAGGSRSAAWFFISRVDVMAPATSGTIVAFGDSITDGATSTPETNRSWPSILAERLSANPATANIAVVNHGISGNRLLLDGTGSNALARFDRDVLSQAGVKWLMILEGINDIGQALRTGAAPEAAITADDIIGAYRQMIDRAHTHGIKVIGCTLTPYVGAAYASDAGEAVRSAVNNWIRTGGAFDAVVDFDAATRDPANPKQFLPAYNNTDKLHPNDAGYKAMADAVDLSLFTRLR
jgi:lysophospholipase L1-like esterase